MCHETADDCLAALKFPPDWSVTSKMIKKFLSVLYADDNIIYFNQDSVDVIFSCNKMGILNNINRDDTNYNEVGPDIIIIHVRLLVFHIKFEKRKAL